MKRILIAFTLTFALSACQGESEPYSDVTANPTTDLRSLAQERTPIATAIVLASQTPTLRPTHTATVTPVATMTKSAQPTPLSTVTQVASATPTETMGSVQALAVQSFASVGEVVDHYVLNRPIARSDSLTDWPDRNYPYGSTQQGTLEVHLGVEFVNPRFTAVASAGDGVVRYAGTDEAMLVGPSLGYYGNVVIVEHDTRSPLGEPVYSLYGHLQRIDVETDQRVRAGQQVGQIGDTGIAYGPHLHFEVRVGEDPFNYRSTRNPELWLRPYPGFGTIAGRVTIPDRDAFGVLILIRNRVVNRNVYTYEGERVNPDTAWGENFVAGDLPSGSYEVIVSSSSGQIFFRETVEVQPGATSWVDIPLDRLPD